MYIPGRVVHAINADNVKAEICKWTSCKFYWMSKLEGYISKEELWQEIYQIIAYAQDKQEPDGDDDYSMPDFLMEPPQGGYESDIYMQGDEYWRQVTRVYAGHTPDPIVWRERLEKLKTKNQETYGVEPYG